MDTAMNKAQVVADLTIQLAEITSVDRAGAVIQRALRSTGLSNAPTLDEQDITSLLQAIAAEGGPVQELAEQIALHGINPTDQSAA